LCRKKAGGASPKNGCFKTFVTDCHADSYSRLYLRSGSGLDVWLRVVFALKRDGKIESNKLSLTLEASIYYLLRICSTLIGITVSIHVITVPVGWYWVVW
jgi:hypothetical protein